jgi:menaquinone-specific isochorismate synthase
VLPSRMENTRAADGRSGLTESLARLALERANSQQESVVLVWESEAPQIDPLVWLESELGCPSFYWKGRTGQIEYAGAGAALTLRGIGSSSLTDTCAQADHVHGQRIVCAPLAHDLEPRFFGGFAFDPGNSGGSLWSGFGDALLILPEALFVRSSGQNRLVLALAVSPGERVENVLAAGRKVDARYHAPVAGDLTSLGSVANLIESDVSLERWSDSVQSALARIQAGSLNKIVLSRRFWLRNTQLRTWPVMYRLRERVSSCFHFAFDLGGGRSFLGATPERLFHRRNNEVETECIAGTAVRGTDADSDGSLAEHLLSNPKERLEHYYVVEDMLRCLGDLCDRLDVSTSPHVLKLATLQHLIAKARGDLRPGTSTGDILSSLHPTPAVGGSPRDAALAAIRELEGASRGWYAGPVGWYARDEAEFAVAIRSALLADSHACIFAGSGIVRGSTPDEEWRETEDKALAFVDALR